MRYLGLGKYFLVGLESQCDLIVFRYEQKLGSSGYRSSGAAGQEYANDKYGNVYD